MGRKRRREPAPSVTLVWPGKDRERDKVSLDPADRHLLERFDPRRLEPADACGDEDSVATAAGVEAWRNRLVLGDNGLAMDLLRDQLEGKIDLIYIDPPYATGVSYFSQTGRGGANMEHRAYRDGLRGGMAGYADTMFERFKGMHALLADNGKIFVHCDWRASAVLRLILDEVFGAACFRNEIIWRRAPNLGRQAASKQLGRVYDSIFVYCKTEGALFSGEVPRRRTLVPLDTKGKPKGTRWDEDREAYFTTAPRGDYTDKSIARLRAEGRIYDSSAGKVYIKYFLTKGEDGRWYKEQPVDALWDDYDVRPLRHRPKAEAMGYDTQKPEGLLERIISWATKPGDLVADFFCGSGTTMAVAQRLGRRWIGCDQQRLAIELCRRRLAALGADFDVFSVIAGERRRWAAGFEEDADAAVVLEAFGAEPAGGRWGQLDDVRVLVGTAVTAMSQSQIQAAIDEVGSGTLVVLAWAYTAFDGQALRHRAKKAGVTLVCRRIPLELIRGGVAPKKLGFNERAEVELEMVPDEDPRHLAVRLSHVRCPDVSRLREDKSNKGNKDELAELSWSDYVDNWRVDFSGDEGAPFTPTWQALRQGDTLALDSPAHRFTGSARVRVKVLTVFGDEVERTLFVEC